MPKRKSEDNYEKLFKKIKKLEKRLRRRRRTRSSSSSSKSSDNRSQDHMASEQLKLVDNNIAELLDAGIDNGVHTHVDLNDTDPVVEHVDLSVEVEQSTCDAQAQDTDIDPERKDSVPEKMIIEILGEDPTISYTYGAEIHKDLAVRLEHTTTHGLTKDLRKELMEKYLVPNNCKLISAPALNAEIKVAMSDITIKRDKSIEQRQKQMSTAIACLSQAIDRQIINKNSDPDLTKMLMDTERILCDLQFNDSVVRRNFILSSLKKDMKDQLQNTKPDNLLFGQDLSENIKLAKAINKSGAELKAPAVPRPQASNRKTHAKPGSSKNLNWKGPNVARKQSNPKTKGPPANNRPTSSSRQSRHQPTTRSRR